MIPNEVEAKIKTLIEANLIRKAALLNEVGLKPGEVVLDVANGSDDKRESEIRVYFYKDGNVIDALEFHIYRNGTLVAAADQVSAWIEVSLADVIGQARSGNGYSR